MAGHVLPISGIADLRQGVANKLQTARSLAGMSTRQSRRTRLNASRSHMQPSRTTRAAGLCRRWMYSRHGCLVRRPINWFLVGGTSLSGIRYLNLKPRHKVAELHRYEAEVQRWIDAYVALETRLNRPLTAGVLRIRPKEDMPSADLGLVSPRRLDLSAMSRSERRGRAGAIRVRVLENRTDLKVEGCGRYGHEPVSS